MRVELGFRELSWIVGVSVFVLEVVRCEVVADCIASCLSARWRLSSHFREDGRVAVWLR